MVCRSRHVEPSFLFGVCSGPCLHCFATGEAWKCMPSVCQKQHWDGSAGSVAFGTNGQQSCMPRRAGERAFLGYRTAAGLHIHVAPQGVRRNRRPAAPVLGRTATSGLTSGFWAQSQFPADRGHDRSSRQGARPPPQKHCSEPPGDWNPRLQGNPPLGRPTPRTARNQATMAHTGDTGKLPGARGRRLVSATPSTCRNDIYQPRAGQGLG